MWARRIRMNRDASRERLIFCVNREISIRADLAAREDPGSSDHTRTLERLSLAERSTREAIDDFMSSHPGIPSGFIDYLNGISRATMTPGNVIEEEPDDQE
jgi:hypothetical protein